MARELRVEFKGDASDLVRASDQAERSLGGMGDKAGGFMGKIGALAGPATAVAGALVGAGAAALDFAKAAAEDEQSAKSLANVLKQTAGASDAQVAGAEKWITATSKSVAIADDELRPALQRLAGATHDTDAAQGLLTQALDIAAGTGKPLTTVVEALTKAQLGQMGGLSKLGLAVTDAQGRQLSLGTVLEQSKQSFGGLAAAATDTASGGMAKASIAMGEMKEQIGSWLLPILGKLGAFMTDTVLPAVQKLIDYIQANWPRIMATIQPVIDGVVGIVKTAAEIIVAIFKGPIGEFLINNVKRTFELITGIIGPALNIIRGLFEVFAGLFTGNWSRMWEGILKVLGGIWDAVIVILRGTWDRVKDVFHLLADLITAPFRAAFNGIAKLWNSTIGALSFHLPDWIPGIGGKGFDVPDIPQWAAANAQARGAGGIVVNMPVGTDPYSTVAALNTYAARAGSVAGAALMATR